MIEQLKTIKTGLAIAIDAEGFVDKPVRRALLDALKAAAQLEAMVGQEEPVAWVDERAIAWLKDHPRRKITTTLEAKESYERPMAIYTAAPVAQQPQAPTESVLIDGIAYDIPAPVAAELLRLHIEAQQPQARPDFTDEWTGYLKDGETPFERFLRERKDVQSVLKLYQRALEENESLKAQQPQADEATSAGLEASISILSQLVDEQRQLLAEVDAVFGVDAHGIVLEDGDSALIDRVRAHLAATSEAKQPQAEKRCQYCDGSGDVHSIDGQWRGECHCQKQPQAEVAHPAVKPDTLVNRGALQMALNVLRRAGKDEVADELEKTIQQPQAEAVPTDALRTFLDAAAGEGLILNGIDAADLYIAVFPDRYAKAVGEKGGA